jgi:hypothetical protein
MIRGLCVTNRRVLVCMIRFIYTLCTPLWTTGIHRATVNFLTLYFIVTHTHTHQGSQSSLVVSWQRIYNSLTVTAAQMKSSLHRLIPFLPLFCNRQFRRLDSIHFICSQTHILAGWRLRTQYKVKVKAKAKATLRLTVSQSVSKSWYRAPSGAHDQIFITVWQLRSCFCGAPSLTW